MLSWMVTNTVLYFCIWPTFQPSIYLSNLLLYWLGGAWKYGCALQCSSFVKNMELPLTYSYAIVKSHPIHQYIGKYVWYCKVLYITDIKYLICYFVVTTCSIIFQSNETTLTHQSYDLVQNVHGIYVYSFLPPSLTSSLLPHRYIRCRRYHSCTKCYS